MSAEAIGLARALRERPSVVTKSPLPVAAIVCPRAFPTWAQGLSYLRLAEMAGRARRRERA